MIKKICPDGTNIDLQYLKSLAIDNIVYSKTLIIRGQAANHEEAKEIFVLSKLGKVLSTRKGYKLLLEVF